MSGCGKGGKGLGKGGTKRHRKVLRDIDQPTQASRSQLVDFWILARCRYARRLRGAPMPAALEVVHLTTLTRSVKKYSSAMDRIFFDYYPAKTQVYP